MLLVDYVKRKVVSERTEQVKVLNIENSTWISFLSRKHFVFSNPTLGFVYSRLYIYNFNLFI